MIVARAMKVVVVLVVLMIITVMVVDVAVAVEEAVLAQWRLCGACVTTIHFLVVAVVVTVLSLYGKGARDGSRGVRVSGY